jgi:hypothetical protein
VGVFVGDADGVLVGVRVALGATVAVWPAVSVGTGVAVEVAATVAVAAVVGVAREPPSSPPSQAANNIAQRNTHRLRMVMRSSPFAVSGTELSRKEAGPCNPSLAAGSTSCVRLA